MSFQILPDHLQATANAARDYFANQHGATSFGYEVEVAKYLPLKPTLSAHLANGYILCVEVRETVYTPTLDTFVVECSRCGFPAKLWVAIPTGIVDPNFKANLRDAHNRGVGIIEISEGTEHVYCDAVSLSLFGLRRTDFRAFPKKHRDDIKIAETTFLNGNPVKGCQSLYEELESLTRAFAIRTRSEGWWRAPRLHEKGQPKNLATGPWAKVLASVATFMEIKRCRKKCPLMSDELIARVRGVTSPRNATSHKPRDLKAVMRRDGQLRTCFESARDLLQEWYAAVAPMHL